MKVGYRQRFVRDLNSLNKPDADRARAMIELIERAKSLREVPQVKPMRGHRGFFRVRIGDYRIGFQFVDDEITLLRCLPRKEVYRHFP